MFVLGNVFIATFPFFSELRTPDWKFLEPGLFCQLLPYFGTTAA
jgi:hypothetical protein